MTKRFTLTPQINVRSMLMILFLPPKMGTLGKVSKRNIILHKVSFFLNFMVIRDSLNKETIVCLVIILWLHYILLY